MRRIRAAALVVSILFVAGAASSPPRYVVIAGGGLTNGMPLVADVVNSRVPSASQALRVLVEPSVPPGVPVRWSSPDGKNDFGPPGISVESNIDPYDGTVGDYVGVYPHDHARRGAVIIADVGDPVNARATYYVRDVVGIGFGCYGFIASGPSVRIVDGIPEKASLANADVAVVGPGRQEEGPSYECWGENYEPRATTYRLVFRQGGRVDDLKKFVKELPFEAVDEAHPLEILSSDGRSYRLHVSPRGTYFDGWIEPLDKNMLPVEDP